MTINVASWFTDQKNWPLIYHCLGQVRGESGTSATSVHEWGMVGRVKGGIVRRERDVAYILEPRLGTIYSHIFFGLFLKMHLYLQIWSRIETQPDQNYWINMAFIDLWLCSWCSELFAFAPNACVVLSLAQVWLRTSSVHTVNKWAMATTFIGDGSWLIRASQQGKKLLSTITN